jgi:hypothetical protein
MREGVAEEMEIFSKAIESLFLYFVFFCVQWFLVKGCYSFLLILVKLLTINVLTFFSAIMIVV